MNACGILAEYTMVVGHLENGKIDGDDIKMNCWETGCEDWRQVELAQDNLTLESSRLCIIGFNIKILHSAYRVHLCALSGLQSRQQLFPSATLLVLKSTVLTAWYEMNLFIHLIMSGNNQSS